MASRSDRCASRRQLKGLDRNERKKSTPPKPGDVASVRANSHRPWCRNCRQHVRYKTITGIVHQPGESPSPIDVYLCLHCNSKMYRPFRVNLFGWLLASFCALMCFPFLVAIALTVCQLLFFEHDPSVYLVVFLIPVIISAPIVFYIRQWFGRWAGYHSWLKRVKELGHKENPVADVLEKLRR